MSHTQIQKLFDEARRAVAFSHHTPPGFDEPTHTVRKSPAVSGAINLDRDNISNLFDSKGKLVRTPNAKIAASSVKLSAALVNASRVASVGAHIIVQPEPTRAIPTGKTGEVVIERNAGAFRTVSAARFESVADVDDVPTNQLPVLAAEIDWESSVSRSVRMVFSRTQQRALESATFYAEIESDLTLGLARAADECMLTAIAASAPSAFNLASVAMEGLRFHELAALVGTSAAGATVGADGYLRAAGVLAELTADTSGTYIAAWDRTAVAVHADMPVHIERLNVQGDLVVTAFANMIPLLPNTQVIWTVPA